MARGWVAALADRLGRSDPAAAALFGLVGRLRRLPHEVLSDADPTGVLARAEAVIAADRPARVAAAVGTIDPEGWARRVAAAEETDADGARDLIDALRPLLARLVARPVPDRADPGRMTAFFQEARSFVYLHRKELRDDTTADAFYRDVLLPEIEARCRAQLSAGWFDRPRRLVTILSESPELAVLTAAIVRPASVLLHFSTKTERHLTDALARLTTLVPRKNIRAIRVTDDTRPGLLAGEVTDAVAAFPPDEVVINLTPGTKLMTVGLWHHLVEPGRRMNYVQTQWGETRGELRFGTEEVVEITAAT